MERVRIGKRLLPLIAGLVMLAAGLSGRARESQIRAVQSASESWPSVEGEVKWSHSREERGRTRGSATWYVTLGYQYDVAGQTLTGTDWYYHDNLVGWSKSEMDALLGELPVGKKVPVYYDPSRVDRAVLMKGAHDLPRRSASLLLMSVGAVFAGLALLLWRTRWPNE